MTTLYSALQRNSHILRSILAGIFVYLQPLRASFYLFTTCGCTVIMVILTYNVKKKSNQDIVNSKQTANQSQIAFSLGSNFCYLPDRPVPQNINFHIHFMPLFQQPMGACRCCSVVVQLNIPWLVLPVIATYITSLNYIRLLRVVTEGVITTRSNRM